MYRARVRFTTPMLWFLGFVIIFTLGGMAGVLLAIPGVDFQAHNSLFLIAHFHTVIIGGVLFGFFAAYSYWFPKFMGFKLDERLGKYAFWCWLIGFLIAFMPLYLLGFMGATRRLHHYAASTGWQPLFVIALIGAFLILIGVGFQLLQLYVSIKKRHAYRDTTADPWDGRNLEWSTTSPPPFYNFAVTPEVQGRDAFWAMKHAKKPLSKPEYKKIHMPKNTTTGLYMGALSCALGFAAVWHMFWLVGLCAVGIFISMIMRLADKNTDYYVTVDEIKNIESGGQT